MEYLQKINTAEKQARGGVTSFFEDNITQSIKLLNQALIVYQTNFNIQAFLGSAYATEFFLSGEESNESLQKLWLNLIMLKSWIPIIDWIVDISHHEFLSCLLKNLKTNSVRLIAY